MSDARAFQAKKDATREASLDERFQRAQTDFHAIVARITRERPKLRVWQWGSLLDRARFSEISDIDIALEGLDEPGAWFDIVGEAMALTSFPLDIIELERVSQENALYIKRSGRLVHG